MLVYKLYRKNDYDNAEYIGEVSLPVKTEGSIFQTIIDVINKLVKIDGAKCVNSGIKSIYTYGEVSTSLKQSRNVRTENASEYVIGRPEENMLPDLEDDIRWYDASQWRTEDGALTTGDIYGVCYYRTGFVLSCGCEATNILGYRYPAYLARITRGKTRTHYVSGPKKNAKLFDSAKKALTFVANHKNSLAAAVSEFGWRFDIDYATTLFRDEFEKKSSQKKMEEIKALLEIKPLLTEISNDAVKEQRKYVPAKTPEEEAENRMRSLGLCSDAIRKFKAGNLMYSEFGGILYDLDEESSKVVELVKEYGVPYHVVKLNSSIGNMISVLYVSNEKEFWATEQYNRRTGEIPAQVYNTMTEDMEHGPIYLRPANGGVVRTY